MKYALSAFLLLGLVFVEAAEVDQFSKAPIALTDSSSLINEEANKVFYKAALSLNQKQINCSNEKAAYKTLRKSFNNHLFGEFTKWIIRSKDISKYSIALENSVYRDWTPWDGLGIGFSPIKRKGVTMSAVVLVGEQSIGIDKFEHMFGQGFIYFKKHYLNDEGLEKTLKSGARKENLILGGTKYINGIFSYGDLGANFNGMRFWNHVLQKNDDVLGNEYNYGPYLICENGKWTTGKEVDFRNYIDASMDESINCSKFPTYKTANKFKKRLEKMNTSCPTDLNKRDDLIVKYGDISRLFINTDGVGKINGIGDLK